MAWLPPISVTPPAAEPLTVAAVREYLRLEAEDLDDQIADWIAGARAAVEAITGTRLIAQTARLQAASFADLDRLPIGPVTGVVAIEYQDISGARHTIDPALYELCGGGLTWGIRPAVGARWPGTRSCVPDAVAVTVALGYGGDGTAVPADLRIALLHLVRGEMDGTAVDILDRLVNHRL